MTAFGRPDPEGRPRLSPVRRLRSRLRPRARPRFKGPSFNRIIPNLLTLIGLAAGLTAVRFAVDGLFGASIVAITLAGCIDGLDGRIARLLKATTRFGAELDSLSDFMCFGTAPALVIYLWSLHAVGPLGFTPCLFFAVCMALRLARFNAQLEGAPRPAYAYNFFTGVPAPAGAGLALLPLMVGLEAERLGVGWLLEIVRSPAMTALMLIGTGFLCISTLPIWSFKNFKIPADYVLPLLLGTVMFVAVLVAEPWAALAGLGVAYLAMLPFSVRSFRRLRREAEAADDEPEEPAEA